MKKAQIESPIAAISHHEFIIAGHPFYLLKRLLKSTKYLVRFDAYACASGKAMR